MSRVARRGLSFLRGALRLLVMMSTYRTHNRALEYSPDTQQHRRKRIIRRWVWGIFFTSTITLALVWGWRFGAQLQYLYWQRQCMNYSVPAGQLIVNSDGSRVSTITWPAAATNILQRASATHPVFMHERISPAGHRRLVVVESLQFYPDWSLLEAYPCVPATGMPKTRLQPGERKALQHPPMKIFAGQIDPFDASHFTIDYELNGERGVIDGWLVNDREVNLEFRNKPPAK